MNAKELLELIQKETNPLSLLLETMNGLKNKNGFKQDLLTPGFIKEWLISEILGHKCHKTKHGPDAESQDGSEKYEYLSCKEGGTFQLDRIHENNLHRITRNNSFFFAEFDKTDGLKCKKIWKVEKSIVLVEATKKIKSMSESSKHIGFSSSWVQANGELVYDEN